MRADQQVAAVGPGKAFAGAFGRQVESGPVDQAALLARLAAAQGGNGDPAGGSAADPDERSVATAAPGVCTGRRYRKPGLVLEEDPGVGRRRGAFTRGHNSIACSSCSIALRAGACRDQPYFFSGRHKSPPTHSPGNGGRLQPEPGPGPPLIFEAMGGRALAQFLLQHRKLGIRDPWHPRRPSGTQGLRPPSRQARRQRSTERSLTRNSFAISAVFSPAANRPSAPSRTGSRNAVGQQSGPHPPYTASCRPTAGITISHRATTMRELQ